MLWQRLGVAEGSQSVQAVRKSGRWRKLESPIKSFMGNSLHLMSKNPPLGNSCILLQDIAFQFHLLEASCPFSSF